MRIWIIKGAEDLPTLLGEQIENLISQLTRIYKLKIEQKYYLKIKSCDKMQEKVRIFDNQHNYVKIIDRDLSKTKKELIGIWDWTVPTHVRGASSQNLEVVSAD